MDVVTYAFSEITKIDKNQPTINNQPIIDKSTANQLNNLYTPTNAVLIRKRTDLTWDDVINARQ